MKITLSKSQWEEVGKKAGWMKTAMTEEDKIIEQIKMYPQPLVLRALQSAGTQNVAGYPEKDVYSLLGIVGLDELKEILDILEENSISYMALRNKE